MLTEEQRNQIIRTLGTISWAAWNTYRALSDRRSELLQITLNYRLPQTVSDATQVQIKKAFAQCDEAWNAYMTVSDAEKVAWQLPFIAHSQFGDLLIDPVRLHEEAETA